MKIKLWALAFALIACLGRMSARSQTSTSAQPQDQQIKTVIDSYKAVISPYNQAMLKARDPERVARSARYDEPAPGVPQIWEDSPAELLSLTNHVTRPALPLASSDAIVLGTVTNASSYLSN